MMTQLLTTSVGRLRLIGFLEGVSFLVLLGIAMPLKYLAGQPEAVKIVGMAHGILFLLYVAAVFQVMVERDLSWRTTCLLLLASLVPFGTFYTDVRILKPLG